MRLYTPDDLYVGEPKYGTLVDPNYFVPSRKTVVEGFLSSLSGIEQINASMTANELHSEGRPIADTVALIPVAAHQEADNIANALDQYAKQESRRPFTVLINPNAPIESDRSEIQRTLDEIEKSKQKHPHLDVRTTPVDMYIHGPMIGTVRRHLWNSALLLAHYDGKFDNRKADVIGLNHDIDVVNMSPRYIDRVQGRVDKAQRRYDAIGVGHSASRPFTTFIKHAYDPSKPNLSRAVFWHDFTCWQTRRAGYYMDAGLVIPFSYYAEHGGMEAGVNLGELSPLTKKAIYLIPGTVLETSPRRFGQQVRNNGLYDIWTEGSFGPDNEYRNSDTGSDISHFELESLVINGLPKSKDLFSVRAIVDYRRDTSIDSLTASQQECEGKLLAQLERRKRLGVAVLDRHLQLPVAAKLFQSTYDVAAIAASVVED